MPPVKSQTSGTEESTTRGRKPPQNINTIFDRLYHDYQLALHQIQTDAKRSCDEAYNQLSRETHKAQVDAFLSCQEAYSNYLTLYQKSQKDPDQVPAAEVHQGYRDYVKVYEAGQTAMQKASVDADQACRKELERCQEDVQAKWRAAFRDYIRAIQKAWSDVDADAVNAASLAAVGQSLIAASTSAASEEQSSLAP